MTKKASVEELTREDETRIFPDRLPADRIFIQSRQGYGADRKAIVYAVREMRKNGTTEYYVTLVKYGEGEQEGKYREVRRLKAQN